MYDVFTLRKPKRDLNALGFVKQHCIKHCKADVWPFYGREIFEDKDGRHFSICCVRNLEESPSCDIIIILSWFMPARTPVSVAVARQARQFGIQNNAMLCIMNIRYNHTCVSI